jgi:flagellar biosynthesis chaperone FliJ
MKDLQKMKVSELRQLCTELGIPKESKGHKFTKGELIENITKKKSEQAEAEQTKYEQTKSGVAIEQNRTEQNFFFAKTLDEIVKKYSKPKHPKIYEDDLKVGSLVIFVHYVEAKWTREIYRKLRSAKVTAVNRKKELIRCETLLGTELELSFKELLYIRSEYDDSGYPKDIKTYLRNQRTAKGSELVHEKCAR